MILRPFKRVLPRCLADLLCFLLVAVFVPITYIFQTVIVLPELFAIGSLSYSVLWLGGTFLVFNLTANMLACMLVETTIKMDILKPPLDAVQRSMWHLCDECEILVPPRAWHCEICQICVLKRDHHCRFACCCVGHYNYRYFFYFLVYMALGSLSTTICTSIYLWILHADFYWSFYTIFKMFCPVFILFLDLSWANFYLLIYDLNLLAFGMAVLLLIYHWPILKRGATMKYRNEDKYDLGLRQNFEMVLGKRMHLTWLSPFVRSDLPHDGINWIPGVHSKVQ